MQDLAELSRVLYRHGWRTPGEWAAAIDRLADLDDELISELVNLGQGNPLAGGCPEPGVPKPR